MCIRDRDGRVAWYWSFIGSLDMARQLGLITEERRQELYEKAVSYTHLNPFPITFADLTGITLTAGIWNSGLQRLEC